MPKTVNLDTLEQDINGAFLEFLAKGGIDVNSIDALGKLKHNHFDRALQAVFDKLFHPDHNQENNQLSLLPYDDINVLNKLINIYLKLCNSTDNDSTIRGFCCMTGYDTNTIWSWSRDELNPERMGAVKRITENRVAMIENKLSDHPIGTTALANNSASLGMMWARNNQPQIAQKAVYIIPGAQTREALGAGSIPQIQTADAEET